MISFIINSKFGCDAARSQKALTKSQARNTLKAAARALREPCV